MADRLFNSTGPSCAEQDSFSLALTAGANLDRADTRIRELWEAGEIDATTEVALTIALGHALASLAIARAATE